MKKLLTLALAATMAFSMVACSAPATSDKLVMGTTADYPPFEFHILEDGVDQILGIDISVGEAIAAEMGKELEIIDMVYDNLFILMNQGKADMVIAAIEVSDERLKNATPSDPYYTDLPPMILVKKENLDQFQSLADFDGSVVGAQTSTTKADIITNDMTGSTPLLLSSVVDLVNNLNYDKCVAVVLDGAVALKYAETNPDLAILEAISLGAAAPYHVWVEKDDPKGLLPDINAAIATLLEGDTMENIIATANEQSANALS